LDFNTPGNKGSVRLISYISDGTILYLLERTGQRSNSIHSIIPPAKPSRGGSRNPPSELDGRFSGGKGMRFFPQTSLDYDSRHHFLNRSSMAVDWNANRVPSDPYTNSQAAANTRTKTPSSSPHARELNASHSGTTTARRQITTGGSGSLLF